MPFFVSSGNAAGKCHAQVDDRSLAMTAMGCDDGNGNRAVLTCRDGRVSCTAAGTGLCAADADAVTPATTVPVTVAYFAHRCGQATYVVAPGSERGSCIGTFDKPTGARALHCTDGAGDTAEFTCRDGVAACAATGAGVCGTDETKVRAPK